MNRPSVSPHIVAEITENAPGRVRRKLDKNPTVAEEWEWNHADGTWTISTGSQTVEFQAGDDNNVSTADELKCSCLLSPRCFHMLACLAVLDVSDSAAQSIEANEELTETDAEESGDSTGIETESTVETDSEPETLSDDQAIAAAAMWKESAALLASGARATGMLLQSRLIRAIHECRATGLHRLANAGLRVIHDTRQVRSNSEEFEPETLVADLSELIQVSYRLHQKRETDAGLIGTARRRYTEVSNLKLTGLFCEPINTRAGHSGIVTYVIDGNGVISSISNVRSGEGDRVYGAWQSSIDVGRLTMSHQELSNSALLVQTGTQSRDRRLGAGQKTRAAKAKGQGWNAEAIQTRFAEPLTAQVDRILAVIADEPELWPAGYNLLFLKGTIVGSDGEACILQLDDGHPIRLLPNYNGQELADADNIEVLSRCDGLQVNCIARFALAAASSAILLALTADESPPNPNFTLPTNDPTANFTLSLGGSRGTSEEGKPPAAPTPPENSDPTNNPTKPPPQLKFAADWGTHINIGLHRMRSANIEGITDESNYLALTSTTRPDGLETFRRRLEALAMGGRHSLPTTRINDLKREAKQLTDQMQPTAAALLLSLLDSALDSETSFKGVRFPSDPAPLATRWLACCTYTKAATLEFQKANWLGQ